MFCVSGDTHGNFGYFAYQAQRCGLGVNDTAIILGDAGLNYYKNEKDEAKKDFLNSLPFTTFCIHGNHEIRPQNISTYVEGEYCGGKILYEPKYPRILFAVDGEVYNFDGLHCLVIGGAYSVDKKYRLLRGYGWWEDEQPSDAVKRKVEEKIRSLDNKVDVVLSHTCPEKYTPAEAFLTSVNQNDVDKTTEKWLDKIESSLDYKCWYCGHWHINKYIDKMTFLYESLAPLEIKM